MEETFSVENPIRENIDYAFKNLIFYVTASTQLDIYIEQKENFKKVLDEINTILAIYVNKESLVSINEEKLQNKEMSEDEFILQAFTILQNKVQRKITKYKI